MPVNPIHTGIHLDKRKKRRKGIRGALFLFWFKKSKKRQLFYPYMDSNQKKLYFCSSGKHTYNIINYGS